MQLTVMRNMAESVASKEWPDLAQQTDTQLERIKWFLWNGNILRAQQTLDELEADLDMIEGENRPRKRLLKALGEFGTYITNNTGFIPIMAIGSAMAKRLRRVSWNLPSTK